MKSNKGITLVSLVVTIIVLIILAGVSINLVLGENGIITRAKQAKTKAEQATLNEQIALNELYIQMEAEDMGLGGTSYDAIAKIKELENKFSDLQNEFNSLQSEYSTFKTAIADAVTDMGVPTASNADATTMASNIRSISGAQSIQKLGTFSSQTSQNIDISQYNVQSVDDVIVEIVSYGSPGSAKVLQIPTNTFYTAYISINIGMATKSINNGTLTIPAFSCSPNYCTLTYGNTNIGLGISTTYATYNVYIIS